MEMETTDKRERGMNRRAFGVGVLAGTGLAGLLSRAGKFLRRRPNVSCREAMFYERLDLKRSPRNENAGELK